MTSPLNSPSRASHPSSPISSPSATTLPGAMKTPSPKRRSPRRHIRRFNDPGSPSSAVRRCPIRQLNFADKKLSPETAKARSQIRKLRDLTHLQKASRGVSKAIVSAHTAFEDLKDAGVVRRVLEHPLVSPERADTSVYPLGSKALEEKEKWVKRIERVEMTGLTFMPGELI